MSKIRSVQAELEEFDAGTENLDLYKKRFINLVTATLSAISEDDLRAVSVPSDNIFSIVWGAAGFNWEFSVMETGTFFSITTKYHGATLVLFAWSKGKVLTNAIPAHKVRELYFARARFWETMTNSFPSIRENLKPVFEAGRETNF